MRRQLVAVILILVVFGTSMVLAQEMNYNSFQVGSRSALMGGAVIAGVRDSSAIFYNPGALGLIKDEEPSLSVSANAFRYGRLTVHDALGSNEDIDADLFDFIPLLVAGIYRFPGAKDWLFGYSIVTRQQYSANFRNQVIQPERNILPDPLFPGNESFLGQFDDSRQVNEVWAIAAASRQIRQDLSVGIAPVLDFRRHFIRQRFSAAAVSPRSPLTPSAPFPVTTSGLFDTTFFQFSLLFRLGIAWEPSEKFKLGLTVTTPNIKLYGKGEVLSETTFGNVTLDPATNIPVTLIGRDFQKKLSTNYRTPLSIGLGAEVKLIPAWTLGVTVEYVDGLSRKNTLDVDPNQPFFAGLLPGDSRQIRSGPFLTLFDERKAVVNVAVGSEYRINDTYAAHIGFWTDFSPIDINDSKALVAAGQTGSRQGFPLAFASVDIFHFILGATRKTEKTLTAIGISFSHGSGTLAGNIDFVSDAGLRNQGSTAAVDRDVSFFSVGLLLGFTYFFR